MTDLTTATLREIAKGMLEDIKVIEGDAEMHENGQDIVLPYFSHGRMQRHIIPAFDVIKNAHGIHTADFAAREYELRLCLKVISEHPMAGDCISVLARAALGKGGA